MSVIEPLDVSDELALAAAEHANKLTSLDPSQGDASYARIAAKTKSADPPAWPALAAAFIAGAWFGERRALDELRSVARGAP